MARRMLRNRTISVDIKTMQLWELKHPNESFSAWVRHCMQLDVLPVEEEVSKNQTLDDVPVIPVPKEITDPLLMENREEAEARAREIMSGFKQAAGKLEENVVRFMARWDKLHSEKEA